MNKFTLSGRLTSTPKLQQAPNGNQFIVASLAQNRFEKPTQFFSFFVWDRNAIDFLQQVPVGSFITISGSLISVVKDNTTQIILKVFRVSQTTMSPTRQATSQVSSTDGFTTIANTSDELQKQWEDIFKEAPSTSKPENQ